MDAAVAKDAYFQVSLPLAPSALRIVPLGGLGEIGMNCLALEHAEGVLVVDCGTSFPTDDHGIDVIHPDLRYLESCAKRIVGVFITHGHEDHIGAVPYLLSRVSVPVWGPEHALGLIRRRLDEHGFDLGAVDLRTTTVNERTKLGPFEVEPIRVAHSIIDATALCIRSPAGTIVHSGDFDFDPDPPFGDPTNAARLAEIGDEGVDLLLSDSTNIDFADRMGSERTVGHVLERLVRAAEHRVFIGLFASNVPRLALLGELAQRVGRKLCLLGRSLNTQWQVGSELGRIKWPSNLLIAAEQLRDYPREQVLALVGGTQAERTSSMYRLAKGNHRWVEVERGDTVLFSSRAIPGNERPINEIVCDLLRLGALVHTRHTDPEIHVSGHASRAEQLRMIELVRPKAFVPIHGTLHHLSKHAALARAAGVQEVHVIENGSTLKLQAGQLSPMGEVPHGCIPIDLGGRALDSDTVGTRIDLGRHGIALISLVLDDSGDLVMPPEVTLLGVPLAEERDATVRAVALEVARLVGRHKKRNFPLEDEVKRAARRVLADRTGCKPAAEVHVLRTGC